MIGIMREFIVVAVIFGILATFAVVMDDTSVLEEKISVAAGE